MLGLTVNTFIEYSDLKEFNIHRMKASKMDINDIHDRRLESTAVVDEPMPELEDDNDDVSPHVPGTSGANPGIQELGEDDVIPLDVTPLRVLPPQFQTRDCLGTPIGYTGSSAGANQEIVPLRTSATDPQGTPGGCSTSTSPRDKLLVPKTEARDDVDQRSRPSLEHFRDTRRKMRKTAYSELPIDAIIDVSDDDEGDVDILGQFGRDSEANKKVKEEALSVSELNAKLEQRMKEKMAEAAEVNARKMSVIEEELRVSNAKTDAILALLTRLTGSQIPPQPSYPLPPGNYPLPPTTPNRPFLQIFHLTLGHHTLHRCQPHHQLQFRLHSSTLPLPPRGIHLYERAFVNSQLQPHPTINRYW